MNREEATNVIKGARQYLTVGNPIWNVKKVDEAMNMAIEALIVAVSREDTVTLNSPISIQAEMVAVVRCKDCRYRKKVGTSYYCELDEFNVKDADFCSLGERREK